MSLNESHSQPAYLLRAQHNVHHSQTVLSSDAPRTKPGFDGFQSRPKLARHKSVTLEAKFSYLAYPSFTWPTSSMSGLQTDSFPLSGSSACLVLSKINTEPQVVLVAIRLRF